MNPAHQPANAQSGLGGCSCFGLVFLLVGGLVGSTVTPHQSRQEPQARIAVTTNLVVLPVNVTDSHGTFVGGLLQQNFRVYEDGQLQKVALFAHEDTPVTVGLLVDHSGSMGPKLAEVAAAVSEFARSSNPHDEMFVVDFSDNVYIESFDGRNFTSDPKTLQRALLALSARGQTALYDAVAQGLEQLELGSRDRRALVIVSDGGDNASRHKYYDVVTLARQAHAVIYSIGLVGNSTEEENPRALERICRDTGGIAFLLHAGQNAGETAKVIARDLREQYVLGYTPVRTVRQNAFRKLSVKVDAPQVGKVRVRTRTGYVARFDNDSSSRNTRK
ncbi:MAG TPA: VWA domain-containing protein [Candidatus Methylomirabilis sp.]|nr:VWA domain-containing protein [Candidatus Methylomirabilis sp.]